MRIASSPLPSVWVTLSGYGIAIRAPGAVDGNTEVFYDNFSLDVTLSVNDVLASEFKIYPNPAKNYLNIESKNIAISSVEMYNIIGKKVISENNLVNSKLNVSSLSTGIYLLKVNSDAGSLVKKIVVE